MSKTYKTTIQPADRNPEFEVVVEYDYHKGDPGRYYGAPELCYPAEPAYVEIISVMHNGVDIEQYLSDDIMTTIEQECEADETARAEYEQGQYFDAWRESQRMGA
jgi:hypothetical protein